MINASKMGLALLRTMAALTDPTVRKATCYLGPKETLKVTRQAPVRKRSRTETYIVTYGLPNYEERQFIKEAIAAGEPFPVKKLQIKFWPEKRHEKR